MADSRFKRGDVVWFNDDPPAAGTHVQHGRRPAVIVSTNHHNFSSTTAMIAVATGNLEKYLYPSQFFVRCGNDISRICCDQIRVVDKHRLELPHSHLGKEAEKQLNEALKYMFDLIDDATETEFVNPSDVSAQILSERNR